MKQVLQNLKTGNLQIDDVPAPRVRPGHLLIQTRRSLISTGTERMLVSFAKSGLLGKAKQQPDKVKQVIDKIKTDGLMPTFHSVFARLDEPLPLGYCNCGRVLEVGAGVENFKRGDRVISNGSHAEIVCVPKNLCARVPDNVEDDEAAFTVVASIGLQGIRLLKPTFGETIVVYGLGLIGLICVQILRNCGCRVLGVDLDPRKLALAKDFGAEIVDVPAGADPEAAAKAYSGGTGVDGVLITASAKEDDIVHQSAQMCRKRGRIILVGVVNLNINRADFYEKELTFQVSCSYGPGRYDPLYEQKGQDYPPGFIRWTEQRNFSAVLNAMADGSLRVKELISDQIPQAQAQKAYRKLTDEPETMALILTYPEKESFRESKITITEPGKKISGKSKVTAGLIGAGNFAKLTLLPIVKGLKVRLKTVADIDGVASGYAARKFGFETATNNYMDVINDPEINTVFITTRHNLHSQMVVQALQAGKNVHVEKPLALNRQQLKEVRQSYEKSDNQLLVGFNRRFSPHAKKIRELVNSQNTPCCMSWLVNAGSIPPDAWVHDPEIGGGRIIGEGCHWLDFMSYVVDSKITTINAAMIGQSPAEKIQDDKMTITATFEDGSIGTLHYFANGNKRFPKENFELFCGGKILKLENFRKLYGYGWSNFKKMNLFNQDKGHKNEFNEFVNSIIQGGEPIIAFDVLENTTLASFASLESAKDKRVIEL